MKFGSTIKQGLYSEWQQYYISYSELKKFLKKRQEAHERKKDGGSSNWDDTDEAAFIQRLQEELTKVSKFQENKVAELHGQISLYSTEVQKLVNITNKHFNKHDSANENGSHSEHGVSSEATARLGDDEENIHKHDGYSSDEGEDDDDDGEEVERRFVELEEDLEVLIADVYDLGRFTHLNYTGFIKIVKVNLSIFYEAGILLKMFRNAIRMV